MSVTEPEPGEVMEDPHADDGDDARVIIVDTYDERQDEFRVTWDYNQNPVHVYDFEGNDQYPPEARVVGAVYLESLRDAGYSWASMSAEEIQRAVAEESTIRVYHFPAPRLEYVEVDGSVAYQ